MTSGYPKARFRRKNVQKYNVVVTDGTRIVHKVKYSVWSLGMIGYTLLNIKGIKKMVKKLLRMGDQRLNNKAPSVDSICSAEIQQVIDELIEAMRHYGGVGIAAPQIGYFLQIMVIEMDSNPRYPNELPIPLTVFINPQLEILTEERESGWEGCLSVPGYRGLVPRYTKLHYRAYDRDGQLFEGEAVDFHARVIQHECDHLNGILFPMRVEDMTQFGCEDQVWERYQEEPYPDHMKKKLRQHWDL